MLAVIFVSVVVGVKKPVPDSLKEVESTKQ